MTPYTAKDATLIVQIGDWKVLKDRRFVRVFHDAHGDLDWDFHEIFYPRQNWKEGQCKTCEEKIPFAIELILEESYNENYRFYNQVIERYQYDTLMSK